MSAGKYRTEKDCLNCGRQVEEHFCSHCGQENLELKEDALHMVTHTVADYLHFENRFVKTVRPLLFRPGFLSTEYVEGRRVRYINPIRLYIFVSIVFFIFTLSVTKGDKASDKEGSAASAVDSTKTGKRGMSEADQQVLRRTLKTVPMPGINKDSLIEETVKDAASDVDSDSVDTANGKSFTLVDRDDIIEESDTTIAAYEARQLALPKDKRAGFLKTYIAKKAIRIQASENASEKLLEGILHNVPKLMFVLLPLFALILKVVYWRKKKYYYEHLIYSFHAHAALFLSILICMLINWIFHFFYSITGLLVFVWMIYTLWYIYKSLKNFYGGKRWFTILKMSFLFVSYTILLSISIVFLVAVTALMF